MRLDPADARFRGQAEVLESLRRLRAPVYAEIDPDLNTLKRLNTPQSVGVSQCGWSPQPMCSLPLLGRMPRGV